MKRGKPKHSEVEQQGRPVGRQFTATSITERFSSRKRMVQAIDLNHEEGQRRLARGSTPAGEAAKWRRAAPASSRHQDSEGTLGQTQTAICSGSRRYTREAGRASMSSACTASVACQGKCRRNNALAHTSAQAAWWTKRQGCPEEHPVKATCRSPRTKVNGRRGTPQGKSPSEDWCQPATLAHEHIQE